MHEATPGLFEILLHLYADGRFASETAIAKVNSSTAVGILSLAVRYLLDKGHQAHVSQLQSPPPMQLMAA